MAMLLHHHQEQQQQNKKRRCSAVALETSLGEWEKMKKQKIQLEKQMKEITQQQKKLVLESKKRTQRTHKLFRENYASIYSSRSTLASSFYSSTLGCTIGAKYLEGFCFLPAPISAAILTWISPDEMKAWRIELSSGGGEEEEEEEEEEKGKKGGGQQKQNKSKQKKEEEEEEEDKGLHIINISDEVQLPNNWDYPYRFMLSLVSYNVEPAEEEEEEKKGVVLVTRTNLEQSFETTHKFSFSSPSSSTATALVPFFSDDVSLIFSSSPSSGADVDDDVVSLEHSVLNSNDRYLVIASKTRTTKNDVRIFALSFIEWGEDCGEAEEPPRLIGRICVPPLNVPLFYKNVLFLDEEPAENVFFLITNDSIQLYKSFVHTSTFQIPFCLPLAIPQKEEEEEGEKEAEENEEAMEDDDEDEKEEEEEEEKDDGDDENDEKEKKEEEEEDDDKEVEEIRIQKARIYKDKWILLVVSFGFLDSEWFEFCIYDISSGNICYRCLLHDPIKPGFKLLPDFEMFGEPMVFILVEEHVICVGWADFVIRKGSGCVFDGDPVESHFLSFESHPPFTRIECKKTTTKIDAEVVCGQDHVTHELFTRVRNSRRQLGISSFLQ